MLWKEVRTVDPWDNRVSCSLCFASTMQYPLIIGNIKKTIVGLDALVTRRRGTLERRRRRHSIIDTRGTADAINYDKR